MSSHFQVNGLDVTDNLPVTNIAGFEVGYNGKYVYVILDSNVTVLFDGEAELMVESSSKPYSSKLCGICGNFDGDTFNDYSLKNGTDVKHLEPSLRDYFIGYSWEVQDWIDRKYGYLEFFLKPNFF